MTMKRKTVRKPTPKRKTADASPAHVGFCIDMSGSMETCRGATISGFNEWLESAKRGKDAALQRVTLVLFNSNETKRPYVTAPLAEVLPISTETYVPNGWTPLYDAIGALIREMDLKVGPTPKKSPLVFVMTDGQENASREYTREQVFEMIRTRTAAGWTFGYLGANQDAWAVGGSLGVSPGNTLAYQSTPGGTRAAMGAINTASVSHRSQGYGQSFNLFGGAPAPLTTSSGAEMLTLAEVAERLKVSSRTVRKVIAQGDLVASRVGSKLRVSESNLLDYLAR